MPCMIDICMILDWDLRASLARMLEAGQGMIFPEMYREGIQGRLAVPHRCLGWQRPPMLVQAARE